jgi:hypothetical protein
MARLPNLKTQNDNKLRVLNLARTNDDSLVLSTEETKAFVRAYFDEELNVYAVDTVADHKRKLIDTVEERLNRVETEIFKFITNRVNEMTEQIIRETKARIIEAEVNKRVNAKLKKIRESL